MGTKFLFSGARGIRHGVWAALGAARIDPSPRVGPCPVHPSWTANPDGPLVSASRSLCPFCREERAAKEAEANRIEDERVIDASRVGATPELDRLLARYEADHPSSTPRPGSAKEREALDLIAQARDDEAERERQQRQRRTPYVAIERIEGGQLVRYVRGRRGRGLTRVVPS